MTKPDKPRWRAVLAGTSRHTGPGLSDVPQVADNLLDLEAALAGPDAVLAEGDARIVLDPQRGSLVLDAIAAQSRFPGERLLFYYSGHGMDHERRLYLALPGSVDARGHRDRTGLAFADVMAQLSAVALTRKRCQVVVILDCCFAGLAMREPHASGVHILMAVGAANKARLDGGQRHTVFTGSLLRLLREGVADDREWLDLDTVYQRLAVELNLADGGPLTPHQRTVDDSGRIPLAVNRARGSQLTPDGLRKRARFAQLIGNCGRPQDAAAMFAQIVSDARRATGADPADVFDYRYVAAVWLSEAGERDQARRDLRLLLQGDLTACRPADVDQARSTLLRLRAEEPHA